MTMANALGAARSVTADTETILQQWGIWARRCPSKLLSYPAIEPYRKMYSLPGESTGNRVYLADSVLEACDKGLAQLQRRDSEMGELTIVYYLYGWNVYEIERRLNVGRNRATMLVRCGRSWMDCFLFGPEEHF